MTAADQIRRLWQHARWADDTVCAALTRPGDPPPPAEAVREYAHVLGAEETWLSRVEGRASRSAIWPTLTIDEIIALAAQLRDGYARVLDVIDDARLVESVRYTNSAGQSFETLVGDILLQVMLHGQYHRGKVNLLLRQSGVEPAPVDFIAFVRGVPAARQPVAAAAAEPSARE